MIRFWNPQLGRSLRLLRLRLSSKIFEGMVCLDVLIQRACPRITRSRTAIPHNSASEQIRGSHFLSCRGLLKCSQAWKIHYRSLQVQSCIQINIKTNNKKSFHRRPTFSKSFQCGPSIQAIDRQELHTSANHAAHLTHLAGLALPSQSLR